MPPPDDLGTGHEPRITPWRAQTQQLPHRGLANLQSSDGRQLLTSLANAKADTLASFSEFVLKQSRPGTPQAQVDLASGQQDMDVDESPGEVQNGQDPQEHAATNASSSSPPVEHDWTAYAACRSAVIDASSGPPLLVIPDIDRFILPLFLDSHARSLLRGASGTSLAISMTGEHLRILLADLAPNYVLYSRNEHSPFGMSRVLNAVAPDDFDVVLPVMLDNFDSIANDPQGSRNLQVILKRGTAEQKSRMLDPILGKTREGLPRLHHLVVGERSTFVLQVALEVAPENTRKVIVEAVGESLEALRATGTSFKQESSWRSRCEFYSGQVGQSLRPRLAHTANAPTRTNALPLGRPSRYGTDAAAASSITISSKPQQEQQEDESASSADNPTHAGSSRPFDDEPRFPPAKRRLTTSTDAIALGRPSRYGSSTTAHNDATASPPTAAMNVLLKVTDGPEVTATPTQVTTSPGSNDGRRAKRLWSSDSEAATPKAPADSVDLVVESPSARSTGIAAPHQNPHSVSPSMESPADDAEPSSPRPSSSQRPRLVPTTQSRFSPSQTPALLPFPPTGPPSLLARLAPIRPAESTRQPHAPHSHTNFDVPSRLFARQVPVSMMVRKTVGPSLEQRLSTVKVPASPRSSRPSNESSQPIPHREQVLQPLQPPRTSRMERSKSPARYRLPSLRPVEDDRWVRVSAADDRWAVFQPQAREPRKPRRSPSPSQELDPGKDEWVPRSLKAHKSPEELATEQHKGRKREVRKEGEIRSERHREEDERRKQRDAPRWAPEGDQDPYRDAFRLPPRQSGTEMPPLEDDREEGKRGQSYARYLQEGPEHKEYRGNRNRGRR
ncbi:hypothetical protein JCM10296v2_001807 [Rhodotorula toruloides]